jgi:hypothetical protein
MSSTAGDVDPATLADIVAEGGRVAAAARARDLDLKVLGGVAISMRCPSANEPPLKRQYADLDLAGRASARRAIVQLMLDLGYAADEQFNAVHGATRLFFWDNANARQLDVFLDNFEMCHKLSFSDRLSVPGDTLPLADLLLMKLQVVETNEKDLLDTLAVLLDHPFTDGDEGISLSRINALTGSDWGWWRTTAMVIERADAFARRLQSFERAAEIHHQVQRYLEALEMSRKSTGWKMRARIGERKRWYELPEESH